jgi:2-(1,2-epoxy-1,2-dihydrophenyl)acetyl-CoA isomerase
MAVEVDHRNAGLWITLARPGQRNALTAEMFKQLTHAFERAASDPSVNYILLRGEGRDFCSGGDLGEFDKVLNADRAERSSAVLSQFHSLTLPWFRAMRAVPQPIIASVRGHAIAAGAQLIIASDLVIASTTLKLSIPQARLAHTMDHGESFSLPRKVGLAKAMELALLGEALDAAAAERAGLINWIVDDEQLEKETQSIADRFAISAVIAVKQMKALLYASTDGDFERQLEREAGALSRCVQSDDFTEALEAFGARRPPVFRGL